MRIWIAGLLALGVVIGISTTALAAPRKPQTKTSRPAAMAYMCPTCEIGADRSRACPRCKSPMGRLATYACMQCQVSAYTPAPCPNCREPLKYIPSQYRRCGKCTFHVKKSLKACPVCTKRVAGRKR